DLGGHLRDLKLDALEICDRLAKLFTLRGVLAGVFPGAAGHSRHLRSDTNAALVQGLDRDLVAFSDFAQYVLLGYAAVFEDQFAGGRGADSHLVFFLADGKSGKVLLNDERGD